MKKFDWNHPVTRKDYAVLYGIFMAIYAIAIAVFYRYSIKAWVKRKIKKIKSKLPWCD